MRLKLAALAFAAFSFINAPAHAVVCSVGGSVGMAMTSTKLDVPGFASLDGISSHGYAVAPEVGCDQHFDKMILGAIARYDLTPMESKASIGPFGASVKFNHPWMIGARLGTEVTPGTMVYGLLGYGGTSLDLASLGGPKLDMRGVTLGGGVEWMISGQWSGKLEYDYTAYGKKDVGGLELTPTSHVVRLGFTYKLGVEATQTPMK